MKTDELIKKLKHSPTMRTHEKHSERIVLSPLLKDEIIQKLLEHEELKGTHEALCKSLTKIIKEEMLKE